MSIGIQTKNQNISYYLAIFIKINYFPVNVKLWSHLLDRNCEFLWGRAFEYYSMGGIENILKHFFFSAFSVFADLMK